MATQFFDLNDRTFRYSHTIGQLGYEGPGFYNPTDVAINKEGVIYVPNRSVVEAPKQHSGIRVVMTNLEEEYLGAFGGYGYGDGQFVRPTAVALDSQQNVYVSDEWLQRISIFDSRGHFLDKWGLRGSAQGQFDRPSGLVFDKEDNLYLVDSANHRVQVFSKDGRFLRQFGSFGAAEGQFNMPWGITIDHQGDIYVVDWRNDRVQKFSPNAGFLGTFGSSGDLVGQFNRPTGVAVDQDGDIYVTDWFNHRVQVFTPQFKYVTALKGDATMSKWGELRVRSNPGMMRMYGLINDMSPWQRFWFPVAVGVDEQNRIIVADSGRLRLQIYVKGEILLADMAAPDPLRQQSAVSGSNT